ncbi:glycosyltransferase [Desulfobulbus oligotrophicus]|jgi:exo-beta-1,3-glucanase (GH17 family)/cellulose synthase/poly-beta-1,6-N-acetylglucosamine synthase-like glycosyltransferase|uniref:Beta-monoglucosyldiacylglycerol synthase n=1 Tax=Desulfobulbus oligotrophicus TaxID=1909699 RepID=A0A7T6AQC7_9BACT|nr:glycosyltransferase [Desulfobulbus oligotrophicus]MDY0389594.1 glycosyltransferase [Desulfobulbus oligotrophicus]QQG65422.1 glycosyltransferase [Desulfobulbus oligotrophicus]
MNRSGLIITLIMGCLAVLLWKVVNAPDMEPPWPTKIQGFSFSPFQAGESPSKKIYPSVEQIDRDLSILAGDVHAVRSYTVEDNLAEIPRLAAAHGLNVVLGAWITPDKEGNEKEITKMIKVYHENHRNIVRVLVGNEVLLRTDQPLEQMLRYLDRVKKSVRAPVSTAEPWHIWLQYPQLVEHVDFIAVHLLPYWESIPVDQAVDYCVMRYNELKQAYPNKEIVISEVGWPSGGRIRKGAVASPANQAKFLRRFLDVAEKNKYTYYIMEAFDQIWKKELEGEAGSLWGVYNDARQPKFEFVEPVIRIPHWRELAAISIALAVIILSLLFRDSKGLLDRGRGFLALIAYTITTFAVWMVYEFQRQYMTISSLLVGFVLLIAATGAILVILAEAHEWAESLWIRKWRRLPQHSPPEAVPDADLPMVSIHVPAYNEPPDMMIETLNALAALDYPRFEVLVIDNNTKDPAVWQPVQEHCKALGERFRFFHVDPLAGFKAGALNYTLRETAPEAEVIAVIDSDYMVEPNWLRALVPQFADENMAIVQAPQDYRDGNESMFKAMCLAEYRGFFQIGMVTRNERNAIIQHGTMTMVRRKVLDEVGGWAEWCITEDAELGLRIFQKGYAASYTPYSFGKGLMPDTFLDYKKQRFRWAYGSVLILRHHMMAMFGLERTKLTRGQRYHFLAGWLPWFADGINMLFNMLALVWSWGMIVFPEHLSPPHIVFALLPVTLFFFKSLKMFFLYRSRVTATRRQSLAAGLAGLALSHTIARAMLTGFLTRRIGFFRTPKNAQANAFIKALGDAREELLFVIALVLAIIGIMLRDDSDMLDVRIWVTVLTIQSLPYFASVVVSLISGLPKLPAKLVGVMAPLKGLGKN